MKWQVWAMLAGFAVLAIALVLGAMGCSHLASDLDQRQRSVQDCILAGGRPFLGPGQTIICQ